MNEDESKLGREAVEYVEKQIRVHDRARKIFDALKGLRRDPRTEYEVSVIGSVTPAHFMGMSHLDGQAFWVGSEGDVLTTENPEPGSPGAIALKFTKAFGRRMDEQSGAIEDHLSGFAHTITAGDAGGLEPVIGDILLEKKDGGFFGHPSKVRLIKPDMTEEQVREAIDFITS